MVFREIHRHLKAYTSKSSFTGCLSELERKIGGTERGAFVVDHLEPLRAQGHLRDKSTTTESRSLRSRLTQSKALSPYDSQQQGLFNAFQTFQRRCRSAFKGRAAVLSVCNYPGLAFVNQRQRYAAVRREAG
jgi:hypothetical protein